MNFLPECAWCLQRSENGCRSLETGVRYDCEPRCRCWELTIDSLNQLP